MDSLFRVELACADTRTARTGILKSTLKQGSTNSCPCHWSCLMQAPSLLWIGCTSTDPGPSKHQNLLDIWSLYPRSLPRKCFCVGSTPLKLWTSGPSFEPGFHACPTTRWTKHSDTGCRYRTLNLSCIDAPCFDNPTEPAIWSSAKLLSTWHILKTTLESVFRFEFLCRYTSASTGWNRTRANSCVFNCWCSTRKVLNAVQDKCW